MSPDRRKHVRRDVNYRCWIGGTGVAQLIKARVRNISAGGAKVVCPVQNEIPDTVDLYMTQDGRDSPPLQGGLALGRRHGAYVCDPTRPAVPPQDAGDISTLDWDLERVWMRDNSEDVAPANVRGRSRIISMASASSTRPCPRALRRRWEASSRCCASNAAGGRARSRTRAYRNSMRSSPLMILP